MQDLAAALHLAGDYAESDKVCDRFRTSYPKSPLLPRAVPLCRERLLQRPGRREAAEPGRPASARRPSGWTRRSSATRSVVDKYPESPHVNLARYGLGMAFYRKGDLDKAQELLEAIPAGRPHRRPGGRAVPAGRLHASAGPGEGRRRRGGRQAGGVDRRRRPSCWRLRRRPTRTARRRPTPCSSSATASSGWPACWPSRRTRPRRWPPPAPPTSSCCRSTRKSDLVAAGDFRAGQGVWRQQKDVNGAMNELRRFTTDPLKNSPSAPMALLDLATLLRGQNQAAAGGRRAGAVPAAVRGEAARDPARAGWVPLLQYHHGVALREAGKRPEARAVFDQVVKQAPDRPEAADAALRFGQCLKDDGQQKIADAPEEAGDAEPQAGGGRRRPEAAERRRQGPARRGAVPRRPGRAARSRSSRTREARARMLYEAAWACRALADLEVQAARDKMQQELWQKRKDEIAKKTPPGQTPPAVAAAGRAADGRAAAAVGDAGPRRVPGADRGLPRPGDQRRRPLRAGRAASRAAANTTRPSSC